MDQDRNNESSPNKSAYGRCIDSPRSVTLPPLLVRRSSSTLVLSDESVHLTPVTPPKPSFKVSSCKAAGSACMGKLQLPFLSIDQLPFLLQRIESASLIPPPLQLGLKTYISNPFHRVVNLLGEDVILLEELNVALGIGSNRLGETDRDGVKVVKVDMGVAFKLAADDGVVTPLDFDEVGDALTPVFFGDFEGVVGGTLVQFVAF